MLVALLFYGYATGVFSSRKLEQATYDSVAVRYISAGEHPDHDTIANFRKRFLDELEGLFKQILVLAQALGVLRMGRVSLDGTKVHGNASKHKAMSWGHATKLEQQLAGEVQTLLDSERTRRGSRSSRSWISRQNWSGGRNGWQRSGKRRRRSKSARKSGTRRSVRSMKRSLSGDRSERKRPARRWEGDRRRSRKQGRERKIK